MTFSPFLGVDPGAQGALVVFTSQGQVRSRRLSTKDAPGLVQAVRDLTEGLDPLTLAVGLEHVHGGVFVPGQKMGATSAFSFGDAYGTAKGVLVALGLPVQLISPREWYARANLQSRKGSTRADRKALVLETARRLFPQAPLKHKADGAVADALLIGLAATRP